MAFVVSVSCASGGDRRNTDAGGVRSAFGDDRFGFGGTGGHWLGPPVIESSSSRGLVTLLLVPALAVKVQVMCYLDIE